VLLGVGGKESSYWSAACSAAGTAMYGRTWPPAGGSGSVYDAAAPWSMSFPGSAPTGSAPHCGAERQGSLLIRLVSLMNCCDCQTFPILNFS